MCADAGVWMHMCGWHGRGHGALACGRGHVHAMDVWRSATFLESQPPIASTFAERSSTIMNRQVPREVVDPVLQNCSARDGTVRMACISWFPPPVN
eukprot:173409-Chlamydomonas_euryale.AAC.1